MALLTHSAKSGSTPASPDLRSYAAFGSQVRKRFASPLASTGNKRELKLNRPGRIDQVSIMEQISDGERIRQYTVEALTGPSSWTQIAAGESIGHKRIHRFPPVEAAAVRLNILKSTAEPRLRNFAVYAAQ